MLKRNVFSFYLSLGDADERAGLRSKLVLGKIDVSDLRYRHPKAIRWFPVVNKDFWAIKLIDVRLGGRSLDLCSDKECLVTPDTGTSSLTMPSWALSRVI